MLKRRLIPKLLIDIKTIGEEEIPILVTTKGFKKRIAIGDPISQAKIYEANYADEIILTNITHKRIDEGNTFYQLLDRLSQEIFMPICVGGGVSELEHFEILLKSGCDKVSLNSSLFENLNLASQASKIYGSQCVVGSVDFCFIENRPYVFDWRTKRVTDLLLYDFCKKIEENGVGEIHICDVDRDGYGIGLNYAVCNELSLSLDIPIILSGGVGSADDFIEGLKLGQADAIAAGTYFCLRDQSPLQARSHVNTAGIPIRI